jgi:hypothetical protein
MADPDFVVEPQAGRKTRLTLSGRAEAWHIRVGSFDLLVTVKCPEPEVPDVGEEIIREDDVVRRDDSDIDVTPEGKV